MSNVLNINDNLLISPIEYGKDDNYFFNYSNNILT